MCSTLKHLPLNIICLYENLFKIRWKSYVQILQVGIEVYKVNFFPFKFGMWQLEITGLQRL